jgi:hypothetical protein
VARNLLWAECGGCPGALAPINSLLPRASRNGSEYTIKSNPHAQTASNLFLSVAACVCLSSSEAMRAPPSGLRLQIDGCVPYVIWEISQKYDRHWFEQSPQIESSFRFNSLYSFSFSFETMAKITGDMTYTESLSSHRHLPAKLPYIVYYSIYTVLTLLPRRSRITSKVCVYVPTIGTDPPITASVTLYQSRYIPYIFQWR